MPHLSEASWIAILTAIPTFLAILVGPIIAVWYTRDGDRRRAEEERRMNILATMQCFLKKILKKFIGGLMLKGNLAGKAVAPIN